MKTLISISSAVVLLACMLSPAQAKWPPDSRVERDVKRHWKKNWPEQNVEHVTKKAECEKPRSRTRSTRREPERSASSRPA